MQKINKLQKAIFTNYVIAIVNICKQLYILLTV